MIELYLEVVRRQAIRGLVQQVTERMRRGEIRRSVWKASLRAEARLPRPTHHSNTLH